MTAHLFVVDTSAWIDAWRLYSPGVFPSLWPQITMRAGTSILAPEDVRIEIERGADDLYKYVKTVPRLFVALDAAQQNAAKDVLARYPDLADAASTRDRADPFVVGLARMQAAVVVSHEKRRLSGRPRIPTACDGFGIRCIEFIDFLREVGIRI